MGVVRGPPACTWDLLCLTGSIPEGEHQLTKLVSGSEGACDAAICRIGVTLSVLSASISIFLLPISGLSAWKCEAEVKGWP